ncbi:hypothetical protein I7I53_09364 [Histoplasma capsulatum var. duboisii H88]|uniref:Uncharacterized protein n=1 Tax=Ajellomyces capsulatus (strain H88) TaxID=544711 RepID=A0A8A1L3X1_AJEC8|nr:hypothetical protein I7I53_09364 [Histoplasma capsulatum var. duboisii H88]
MGRDSERWGRDATVNTSTGGGGRLLRFPPISPSALDGDKEEGVSPRLKRTPLLPLSAQPSHPPALSHTPPPIPPPPSRTWIAKGSPPGIKQQGGQGGQRRHHHHYQQQAPQERLQSNTSTHSDNLDDDKRGVPNFRSTPHQTPASTSTSLTRLDSNASTTTTTSTASKTPTTSSSSSSSSNNDNNISSVDQGADTQPTTAPRRAVPFKISTASLSSSSDSYFPPVSQTAKKMPSSTRLRSASRRVRSPLSLSGAEPTSVGAVDGIPDTTPLTTAPPSVSGISVSDEFPPTTAAKSTSPNSVVAAAAAAAAAATSSTLEAWDYAETEWWGWIILVVTWLVFVIGMGSCLGVWSWAWDVGETPYAPPELEDDPTLPIVGYYPALIILTAVMAWVWVVVAWVGMKYFRHANISGEDI